MAQTILDAAAAAAEGDDWDQATARALVAALHARHAEGDSYACHLAAVALAAYCKLVRIIVPQQTLWTVNPYRRCDFRCGYCSVFAQGAAAPVLLGEPLRRQLRRELALVPRDHHLALSSMCDAYVPAEARHGVARIAIEELLADDRCVHVVTKGTVVRRDVDLLRRARCAKVEVSMCTLDPVHAARLEPGAAPPAERLALARELADAGLDVGISLAPWIPGITDVAAVVRAVGPARRVTISPLKCNAGGGRMWFAGRPWLQEDVNRRYVAERERFHGHAMLRWEAPWRFGDHYRDVYRPMEFVLDGDQLRSPEPPPDRVTRTFAWLARRRVWTHAARGLAAADRATGGRLRVGRQPHLLLTTYGRRSGRSRTVLLWYVEVPGGWAVVAANGGADRHPHWWRNLCARPEAMVRVGRKRASIRARAAYKHELRPLWTALHAANPLYRRFLALTARGLPVVVLERVTGCGAGSA
ncbi:MAG: nitroreductase family deazaflavin-dependent oxidoreductase [bacterium]|nr:nitroreductase family deazaflavin-dependent oxidoreductase [bacterium]